MTALVVAGPSGLTEHDGGARHPERPSRLVAVMDGVRALGPEHEVVPLASTRRPWTSWRGSMTATYLARLEAFCAEGGGDIDADTYARPDSWAAARRGGGRRPGRARRARPARRGRRLRPRPATRPSRHRRPRHGVLPRQQRGRGRGVAHGARGAGPHRGLGRAPRERHPGHLLGRPRRALRLDPPASPLPGHGPSRRGRRPGGARPHPQPPAAAGGDRRRGAGRARPGGARHHRGVRDRTGCWSRAGSTPTGTTRSATWSSRAGTSPSWLASCASSRPGRAGSPSSWKAGTTRLR